MSNQKYYTPLHAARLGLEMGRKFGYWSKGDRFIDPCAGSGRIDRAAHDEGYEQPFHLYDIDPDFSRVFHADVRELDGFPPRCDAIVTNPPFAGDHGSAGDILRNLRDIFDGPIGALTRIGFLESCRDHQWAWWQGDPPEIVVEVGRIKYDRPDGSSVGSSPRFSNVWMYWAPYDVEFTRFVSVDKGEYDGNVDRVDCPFESVVRSRRAG